MGAVVIRLCCWGEVGENVREVHRFMMVEKAAGEGQDHLSATAAAMGTRIVPRAVAANSSISVFNRLMTHSIASRP